MSTIYNRAYRVPVWVVLAPETPNAKELGEYLAANGAEEIAWPSASFFDTVKGMTSKGWGHIAEQKYPYHLDSGFLPIAAIYHIKKLFGESKMFSGAPMKPWSQAVSRRMASDKDYVRVFDEILSVEDPIALSHMFSIGDRCHTDSKRTHVFFTYGTPLKNVLQRVADAVIVVGEGGTVSVEGRTSAEIQSDLESAVLATLGHK